MEIQSHLEDLTDSRSFDCTGLTIPEVYVCNLLGSGNGLPCWDTSPFEGERGAAPGDVGTYTAEGGFKRMFNLWDDEASIRRTAASLSIDGKSRYRAPRRRVVVAKDRFREGDTVTQGAYASKTTRSHADNVVNRFEFRCRSASGAVLACTYPADKEELAGNASLRKHIIEYAQVIYRHANGIWEIEDDEALYIVTGVIKTQGCGLAAYNESMEAPHDVMVLQHWATNDEASRWGWVMSGTADSHVKYSAKKDGVKDQSLFLRGFKLDFSREFRARADNHPSSSGGEESDGGTGPGTHDSPDFQPKSPDPNDKGKGVDRNPSGDGARGQSSGQHRSGTSDSAHKSLISGFRGLNITTLPDASRQKVRCA